MSLSMCARSAPARLLLLSVGIHRRRALGRLGGFGAGIRRRRVSRRRLERAGLDMDRATRSEEHTSELQSLRHLVCRLLLEKKKKNKKDRREDLTAHDRARAI